MARTKKLFDPEAHALKVLRREFSDRKWIPRMQAYHRAMRAFGLVQCATCPKQVIRDDTQLDHIIPVIPLSGSDNDFKALAHRLYCQADGLQVLCLECHKEKTRTENAERVRLRKLKKEAL